MILKFPGASSEPPMPAREAMARALLLAVAHDDDVEPDYWEDADGWEHVTGQEADALLAALRRLGWRLVWEGRR